MLTVVHQCQTFEPASPYVMLAKGWLLTLVYHYYLGKILDEYQMVLLSLSFRWSMSTRHCTPNQPSLRRMEAQREDKKCFRYVEVLVCNSLIMFNAI
jgi:hypothetical protein